MLKVYRRKRWVSIDNKEWQQTWYEVDVMKDDAEPNEVVVADHMSFDELYNRLQNKPVIDIRARKTLFRRRPKITIEYTCDQPKRYTHFDTISLKITYEEIKNPSLYNIMRFFSADQTIQYLKERGITTCPMNF